MMRNQLPSWTYGEIDLYLSPAISMCCSYCLYYILSSSQNKCKIFSCFRVTLPKACLLYILSFCVITKKANSPALVVKFYVTYSVNLINLYFSGLVVWQDCFKGHRLVMLLFWFIEQQGMPSSIWDYYYFFFGGWREWLVYSVLVHWTWTQTQQVSNNGHVSVLYPVQCTGTPEKALPNRDWVPITSLSMWVVHSEPVAIFYFSLWALPLAWSHNNW